MADWEEIKRLAADFQRTQESDTLQRISERNCIDIVKKLTDMNLIDLIYTCDGKEFITPNHLLKEVEDEVYVNGGRVHIHELATTLNVDYQHVENISKNIVSEKPDEYSLILGQIIHSTYKTTLEKQIHDTMSATGQLNLADFAKTLDLPSEFLSTVVQELLPRVMQDFVVSSDERTYYTTDMMDRYKSIIAGTLTAVTKPTNIASIIKKLDIPERMFSPIVDSLIKEGRLDARIENRLYIPAVHAREQSEWVDKFYSSNSYIDYDMLSRMDIKQPKAFLRKRFPNGYPLKTCFVSQELVLQVESMVEECIATNGVIDISSVVPPSIQAEDIDQLLHEVFKNNKQFESSCIIINQTNVCSLGYIATCKKSLTSVMDSRAEEHLKDGKLVNYFLGGQLKNKKQSDDKNRNQGDQESEFVPEDGGAKESTQGPSGADDENVGPQREAEGKSKSKNIDFELTAEDLKRERRQKKGKGMYAEPGADMKDSDDDQGGKKSKSRKSGLGVQGREIKQKAVKKKYLVGNKGKNNEDSDDEMPAAKAPKSNKGRAARRALSPEPPQAAPKSTGSSHKKSSGVTDREPLVFMDLREMVDILKERSRDESDIPDALFESIADLLESELNKTYESRAKKKLDDYLRSLEDEELGESSKGVASDINLI